MSLAPWQLVAVNILAWCLIHLSVPYVLTRLPARLFRRDGPLCRRRSWERDGTPYERLFGIRRWKDALPDGAAVFRGGFRKRSLARADTAYLERFAAETRRGELAHWLVLAAAGLFFAWNPWPLGLLMIVYAVAANAPCILAQRYNRLRLLRLLARRRAQA